jgi:hypothetical protein
MSNLWRVDKALEDSEGLGWVRERLRAYDWSKVDWIKRAAWTKRDIRILGCVQGASERMRIPNQLQREQACCVPNLPFYARISLVSQPRRDMAGNAQGA